MVENRAEDTALFHGLALPSAEAACAFTEIPLCLLSRVPPLTSAIRQQQPLLLASLQTPTSQLKNNSSSVILPFLITWHLIQT